MLEKEGSTTTTSFDLPEELLKVLLSDPYDQLDVARRITSLALSSRISSLKSEAFELREKLSEKDDLIADLQSRIDSLDAFLLDSADKLSLASPCSSSVFVCWIVANWNATTGHRSWSESGSEDSCR